MGEVGKRSALEILQDNIGDFQGRAVAPEKTLLDVLGITDDVNGSLLARLGAYTSAAPLKTIIDSIETDTKYINDVACPAAPVAGSILQVLVEDIYERTLGEKTLEGLLGVADIAGRSIIGNLGDFQARATAPEKSLLAVLGIPDDANGSFYERFGAYTDVASLKDSVDQIETDTDPLVDGRVMMYSTTQDLNNVAGDYPLFTGATQAGIIEEIIVIMPDAAPGGAITAISIQTNHTTPQILISAAQGAVANLIAENQLYSNDPIYIAIDDIVNLTIVTGASAAEYIVTVIVKYRPIVSGGNLT